VGVRKLTLTVSRPVPAACPREGGDGRGNSFLVFSYAVNFAVSLPNPPTIISYKLSCGIAVATERNLSVCGGDGIMRGLGMGGLTCSKLSEVNWMAENDRGGKYGIEITGDVFARRYASREKTKKNGGWNRLRERQSKLC